MAAVKDELLHLGRTILHAYFEETNLGPLLAHLAPDVIWLGAGQEMLAEGRTAVTAIFEKGQRPADSLPAKPGADFSPVPGRRTVAGPDLFLGRNRFLLQDVSPGLPALCLLFPEKPGGRLGDRLSEPFHGLRSRPGK